MTKKPSKEGLVICSHAGKEGCSENCEHRIPHKPHLAPCNCGYCGEKDCTLRDVCCDVCVQVYCCSIPEEDTEEQSKT